MARRKITPVETTWRGVTYRSRTEARWAVFFDTLGAEATYEPESYSLDGAWYLPDFWVASWNLFVEIKGETPTSFERERCEKLAALTGKNVVLMAGAPGSQDGEMFVPARDGEPATVYFAAFARCRRCDGYALEYWSDDAQGAILLGSHRDWLRCGDKIGGERQTEAVAAARNERFGVHPGKRAAL